jgi:hypothetical protein
VQKGENEETQKYKGGYFPDAISKYFFHLPLIYSFQNLRTSKSINKFHHNYSTSNNPSSVSICYSALFFKNTPFDAQF